MSNNKQDHIVDTNKMVTAVEWLFNDYVDKGVITIEAIDKALKMEKEQIINAVNQKIFGDITFTGSDEVITKGENYYNQIYNK